MPFQDSKQAESRKSDSLNFSRFDENDDLDLLHFKSYFCGHPFYVNVDKTCRCLKNPIKTHLHIFMSYLKTDLINIYYVSVNKHLPKSYLSRIFKYNVNFIQMVFNSRSVSFLNSSNSGVLRILEFPDQNIAR